MSHAVSRLRAERMSRSTRPFLARGGPSGERCGGCRLRPSHCLCALQPRMQTQSAVCLLMHDAEPLKPSNTGWLIADVVADTFAFGWSRTQVDPQLLALLQDPQWQPYVVFPGEFVAPERVVSTLQPAPDSGTHSPRNGALDDGNGALADLQKAGAAPSTGAGTGTAANSTGTSTSPHPRPLFILLDATWSEARKMFRKSPYIDRFPVLSFTPDTLSRYQLRRSRREDHFCTSEVAALCLDLAGEEQAAQVLQAYLDVYTHHYLQSKHQLPPDHHSPAHQRVHAALAGTAN